MRCFHTATDLHRNVLGLVAVSLSSSIKDKWLGSFGRRSFASSMEGKSEPDDDGEEKLHLALERSCDSGGLDNNMI
jgi:hypothetical protein